MVLRLYRLTSHSLCTPKYAPRIFLRENKTASAKLFKDASSPAELVEERRLAARREHLELVMGVERQQGENWTGDESLQDAVLRMLVDKYRPTRDIAGGIKTADEKLKANPPLVNGRLIEEIMNEDEEGSRIIRTNTIPREPPILPGIEGHEPWMTTFKTPSFAKSPQIKVMRLPPLGPPSKESSTKTEGESKAKMDRGKMKRVKEATRIENAKERMLDYRYGTSGSAGGSAPNPTTMRGWQSLIDDRIEKSRAQGEFSSLKGHGKPLTVEIEAKNPFISREEYFVNRMIQRQGATPPWVELQQELDQAISSFRSAVRASWIRRAVRLLTMTKTRAALLPSLSTLSASDLSKLYDHEWEQRERGFHEAAIGDINSLVRKYNGIAPYAVRRPYHNVKGELELCYERSGEALLEQLKQREQHAAAVRGGKYIDEDDEDRHSLGGASPDSNGPTTFWERFTRVLMHWLSPPPPSGTIQQH